MAKVRNRLEVEGDVAVSARHHLGECCRVYHGRKDVFDPGILVLFEPADPGSLESMETPKQIVYIAAPSPLFQACHLLFEQNEQSTQVLDRLRLVRLIGASEELVDLAQALVGNLELAGGIHQPCIRLLDIRG
eukprot:1656523-Prymnesium_polylepis.1